MFSSCIPDYDHKVDGLKPIYMSSDDAFDIKIEVAQKMVSPGKIYIYNNYLFVNEKAKGIHVINNANPSNPQKIAFINIPGNYDMAVKGNVMYVDNFTDIVALSLNNVNNITVLKRIKNAIKATNFMSPDNYTGYFECVDTTKGYVIGWEETKIVNPKCYN
jgi:hypothetical protein